MTPQELKEAFERLGLNVPEAECKGNLDKVIEHERKARWEKMGQIFIKTLFTEY